MRFILTLPLILLANTGISQDIMYSTPQTAPLEVNPTYAGNDTCSSARIGYRLQWPGVDEGIYQTNVAASLYMPMEFMFAGMSYKYVYDGVTDFRYTSFFISKNIKLSSKQELRLGGSFAFYKGLLDWNKVDFNDQVDSSGNGAIYPSADVPRGGGYSGVDFNGGISYHNRGFYLGVAVYHINQPNASVLLGQSPMPTRFSITSGYSFGFSWLNHTQLSGLHVWFNQQGPQKTLLVLLTNTLDNKYGLNYAMEISGGINKHSFQLSYALKWFTLGYAFDYYPMNYVTGFGNAHECFLKYSFWKRKSKIKSRSKTIWT